MPHAETILESCLAIAEQRMENQSGIHSQKFVERLTASVAHDKQYYTPERGGYNADRSDHGYMSENEFRRYFGDVVDYGGVTFYDTNP